VSKYAQVVLDSAAYAGTGNVLKIQELLGLCGEHIETEEATAWKVRTILQGGVKGVKGVVARSEGGIVQWACVGSTSRQRRRQRGR
jgi:hypothetical protein